MYRSVDCELSHLHPRYIELLVAITGTLIVWTAVAKLHVLAGPAT